VPDAAIKKQLQHMADGYDLIAERAEAREKRMPLTLTALL
jgi:Ner family transcriptional regulator